MERARELFERIKREGKSAIDEFILIRKTEELFLDFKRSADNGDGQRLHQNDRNNLAKCISGFGNSEGGVVIWGIDCSKDLDGSDVAKDEHPITNVKRFVSWLEGAISGCTIPPHTGIQNYPLETDSEGKGFVVTYIPKSEHAPHQEIQSRKYFIRAGSSFMPTPHDVLAGMFGRRPQPKIKGNYKIYPLQVNMDEGRVMIRVGFHICNEGATIAENLFVSVLALSIGGPNCHFIFIPPEGDFRIYRSTNCFSSVSSDDIRLPPGGWLEIGQMELELRPPFEGNLKIEGAFGCGNTPPLKYVFENSKESVESWYKRTFPILRTTKYDDKKRIDIVNELFSIQTPE